MKETINYEDPKFEGLSKKKIKKLVKSEKYEANKSEWKKAKREAKKKRKIEQKASQKPSDIPIEPKQTESFQIIADAEKPVKLGKKELKKLVLEKFDKAPIVIIDASFEDSLDHSVSLKGSDQSGKPAQSDQRPSKVIRSAIAIAHHWCWAKNTSAPRPNVSPKVDHEIP